MENIKTPLAVAPVTQKKLLAIVGKNWEPCTLNLEPWNLKNWKISKPPAALVTLKKLLAIVERKKWDLGTRFENWKSES